MRRTGLLFDERFLLHRTGPDHPEAPERLGAVYSGLKVSGLLSGLRIIGAKEADLKWIEAVHDVDHIRRIQEACIRGVTEFDHPDNQICECTYDTAVLAVGGVLEMARLVMEGELDNGFCAVRPPGHHAERDKAMGFCYFNNVAVAARYLQMQWNVKRIGIVDFDVHHGNGTQHIFERDPTVFFYSIHEHPTFCYPGTGREFERGLGEGMGFTLNSPMLPGQGDKEYKTSLERDLFPAFAKFQPEVILVSAGFDAHADDDMADMNLSTECFSWIMREVVKMADTYSNGRLVSILEGGYSLERLPELIRDHVAVLLGI